MLHYQWKHLSALGKEFAVASLPLCWDSESIGSWISMIIKKNLEELCLFFFFDCCIFIPLLRA